MKDTSKVIVAGLGEVGEPLFELLSEEHDVIGVDVGPLGKVEPVAVLHICYPSEIQDFVGESARYIEFFKPALTVVNSTVGVGTTRAIEERTGAAVVNSPIRGKHACMLHEMKTYTKFIGAIEPAATELAVRHFESVGLKTKTLASPEAHRTCQAHRDDVFRFDDCLGHRKSKGIVTRRARPTKRWSPSMRKSNTSRR